MNDPAPDTHDEAGDPFMPSVTAVIEIAARHGHRDLHEVAFDLVSYAERVAPDRVDVIEAEIDEALQQARRARRRTRR